MTTINLSWTANATGTVTTAELAAAMLAAWTAADHTVLTVLYQCTIFSASVSGAGETAKLTVEIHTSAAFNAAFPATPPDMSPFYDMFSPVLRYGAMQPVLPQLPVKPPG